MTAPPRSTGSSPDPGLILGWQPRLTVRLRLTLSYAGFLVVCAVMMSAIIYAVMKYIPDYPLTSANDPDLRVASRGEILQTLVRASGIAIALLAAVGLAGGWILAGHMLKPLQQINQAARLAAAGALDYRLGLTGRSDEFKDLADTFDEMLDRLEKMLREHQRFAANASHELRTPQAITKIMLEVAMADHAHEDVPELMRRLHETNERGIGIVQALLALADLDHQPVIAECVDLAATTSAAVEDLLSEADTRGVRVSTDLDPCEVAGDPVLIRHLVTNLVQNAIRHNTATEGFARIHTGVDPHDAGRALLLVSNTGGLIPPGIVSQLTEPFVRGRERLAGTAAMPHGHGLGLALAAKIVSVHRGELHLSANPTGGLTVKVQFPRR